MNVLQKLQSETIRSELSLLKLEAGARGKVLKLLNDLENEIVGQLTAIDPTTPTMTAYKQARLEKLLREVKVVTNTAYKKAASAAAQELEGAAIGAVKAFANSINFAVGAKIAKATIPQSLLTKLVDTTLVETAPSSDWWARQPKQLVEKFYDQMRLGLAKGDTLDQLVQRVRGTPARNGQMAKAGVMDVSRRNAEALVRTATQSITNQARIEAMTANRDVVKGVQWLATLDNRTTEICRKLDGKVWRFVARDSMDLEPEGHDMTYPGPTAHWGCRSVVLPWLKSWEDMAAEAGGDTAFAKQLDSMTPGTRSALNGQVPATLTYADWLASLPKEDAMNAVGGAVNFRLWQAGKLVPTPELANMPTPNQPPRVDVDITAIEDSEEARDSRADASATLDRLFEKFLHATPAYRLHAFSYTQNSNNFNRWLTAGSSRSHEEAKRFIERDEALQKMFQDAPALSKAVTVFSGVRGSMVKSLEALVPGSSIELTRYLSSSLSGSKARNFTTLSEPTLIQLQLHKGTRHAVYIDSVSEFKEEEFEMLIKRGATLRLLRRATADIDAVKYTVYIMEIVDGK